MTEPLDLAPIKARLLPDRPHLWYQLEADLRRLIAEVERLREAVLAADEVGAVAAMVVPTEQVDRYYRLSSYWTEVQYRIVYPAHEAAPSLSELLERKKRKMGY